MKIDKDTAPRLLRTQEHDPLDVYKLVQSHLAAGGAVNARSNVSLLGLDPRPVKSIDPLGETVVLAIGGHRLSGYAADYDYLIYPAK